MTPTKILIGQAFVVMLIITAAMQAATQYVAGAFGFDPALGAPFSQIGETPLYYPWRLFEWWYAYEAYAPDIFMQGGAIAAAGGMVGAYTFDKVGPLARSTGDCRLVLGAIAGPDPRDPSCASERVHLERGSGRPLRSLRAALVPLDWSKVGEPEVKAAFDAAVAELRGMGLKMEIAELPAVPASEVSGLLIGVEALAAFEPFLNDGRVKLLTDDIAPHQRSIAEPITGADTIKAMRIRDAVQTAMRDWLQRYDIIVTPNFMSVAPPVNMDLNETLPYGDPVGGFAAACGLPGLALPAGFGKSGMPAGFQLVGSPFDEATLFDLGEAYQARTKHHRAHPALA